MMKNKVKLKKLLLYIIILFVFLLSLFLIINIYEYHIYNNNFNKKISSIVSKIEESNMEDIIYHSREISIILVKMKSLSSPVILD